MNNHLQVVLKTLVYADLFDYSLRQEEIWRWLISGKKIGREEISLSVDQLVNQGLVGKRKEFYYLKGREQLSRERELKEKSSILKLAIAKKVAEKLFWLPTVRMVAVTGALAMKNSPEEDDIDLMIITFKHRLWLTRMLTLAILQVLGNRRRPKERVVKDKICPNIFLDENNLTLPKEERNLFSAHEVCQINVLVDKDKTYKNFLEGNIWVKNFLPNFAKDVKVFGDVKAMAGRKNFFFVFFKKNLSCFFDLLEKFVYKFFHVFKKFVNKFFDLLEKFVYKLQVVYMQPRRSIEKIEIGRAFFHPRDNTSWVLGRYQENLDKLGLINRIRVNSD